MDTKRKIDWEHYICDKMENYCNCAGFPQPEDFNTTDKEARSYIYDKQRILDREEERRTHLVVPGIILVMPVIILSAFGNDLQILFAGIALGVILMMAYFFIMKAIDKHKLKAMRDEDIELYIEAIEEYNPQ